MLSPGFLPTAGFAPPGCAVAYSAYVFPDTLVSTTFHDYYLTLAVLNTIVSIWLSCYSRYPAALPQRARGEGRVAVERGAPWTAGGDRGRGAQELGLSSTRTSRGWAGPASQAHGLCWCSGPHDREGVTLV